MDDIKKTTTHRGSAEVRDTPVGRIFVPSPSTGGGPDNAPILEGYLTEDQLAAALGRSPRTLARWRALDEGPPVTRIGRELLYRKSSVKSWLEKREQA